MPEPHDLGKPVGIILAGGRSRRLGQDKAVIEISGRTLLVRGVKLLSKCCEEVYISGRDPEAFGLDLPWFPDDHPGLGPMGGIVTSLDRVGRACLVISCDLPLLNLSTLGRLLAAWAERPAGTVMTTFLQMDTGYIESLVAVYDPEALPHLLLAARAGQCKLSVALPPALRWHIPYASSETSVFFNINYPEDLARLRRLESAGLTGADHAA